MEDVMPPVVIDLRSAEDWRDVVHRAVQALVEGGVVAFPTETVYGLAASALDERAVDRLLATKDRATAKPLTLAIKSDSEARDYAPICAPWLGGWRGDAGPGRSRWWSMIRTRTAWCGNCRRRCSRRSRPKERSGCACPVIR